MGLQSVSNPECFMQHIVKVLNGTYIDGYYFVIGDDIAPKYSSAKNTIVSSYLGEIEHPHCTESYYILAKKCKRWRQIR